MIRRALSHVSPRLRLLGRSRPRRRGSRQIAASAMLLALAGCGSISSLFGSSSSDSASGSSSSGSSSTTASPDISASGCPTTVVLQPLANTVLLGPGKALQQESVAYYGVITDAHSKCGTLTGTLRVSLDVVLIGERGPLGKSGDGVDLNYFVAVVGPGQTIVSKKPFSVHITLPPNAKRAGVTDHIEEAIPLNGARVSDLAIDVGFQQTPDAIEFYKRFRGR